MERIEKLKHFLESNPGDAFVQHALGLEYVKIGDVEKAEKIFSGVLERDPGYTGRLSSCQYWKGRSKERP